jgi:hypothetical protein
LGEEAAEGDLSTTVVNSFLLFFNTPLPKADNAPISDEGSSLGATSDAGRRRVLTRRSKLVVILGSRGVVEALNDVDEEDGG